eukprot:NODE_447_length_7292_cov_0.701932.p1 type:complete len:650 gc:universal NODE_447_length_7292_cov_0.701932:3677-5626(+)
MLVNLKSIIMTYLVFMTRIFGVSADCPVLMNFIRGLNLHLTDPDFYKLIPTDCCGYFLYDAPGGIDIGCSGTSPNERVVSFILELVKINGTIKSQYIPTTLYYLQITNTLLNTTLPIDLPDSIVTLNVYNNNLRGSIPDTLPSQLKTLNAYGNQFTGISKSLPNSLSTLNAYNNRLTRMPNIPSSLQVLHLANNQIFDQLPSMIPSLLTTIHLENNLIYGSIPNNLPSTLLYCYLNSNDLQGNIPTNLPSQLNQFEVSGNLLTGSIPTFPSLLKRLRLDSNLLTGTLPTWPSGLIYLNASSNMLSGDLSSFTLTNKMTTIDVSWNSFTGNIPVFSSSIFNILDLSYNQLNGDIDLGYVTIYDLRLSFNNFENYPKTLPQAVRNLKLDNNLLSGDINTNFTTSSLTTIDLSNNYLTGNIPNWLNVANRIYLNISHNLFTGSIPATLQSVATFDASFNFLSGCINFQFTGSNFYFNDNYLSGNLSFATPLVLYLQNNRIIDVTITNATPLGKNCSLANNPMSPGVFGKTFKNQCNVTGVYVKSNSTCRILALSELTTIASRTSRKTSAFLTTTETKGAPTAASQTTQDSKSTAAMTSVVSQMPQGTTTSIPAPTIVVRILHLFRSNSLNINCCNVYQNIGSYDLLPNQVSE